ncbi:MAG: hypothetical protein IT291_07045, partial [Deltaproteobacteria bacterium]|nr:hypothetical protein [Deltaproteobacteria bacterium]
MPIRLKLNFLLTFVALVSTLIVGLLGYANFEKAFRSSVEESLDDLLRLKQQQVVLYLEKLKFQTRFVAADRFIRETLDHLGSTDSPTSEGADLDAYL